MAQEPAPSLEDLQKQIDAFNKQKELINAQKSLSEAQKSLTDAQRALTPEGAQLADQAAGAKAAKEVADAQKALADAKKAQADASAAAFKASSLGDVPTSGYTGAVEVKDKTGELEAALLAMRAVREAARTVAANIRAALAADSKIVVFAASDMPTFQTLIAYKAQVAIVQKALEDALAASRRAGPEAGAGPEVAVPPFFAAGAVLEATNKLLSFFRTDYAVGGIQLTVEDGAAVGEVANLLCRPGDGNAFTVTMPGVYNPTALADSGQFLVNELAQLSVKNQMAETFAKAHDAEVERLTKKASGENDPAKKGELQEAAAQQKSAADGLRSAMTLFSTWFGKLSAPDDKGAIALVTIARERAIENQLGSGQLLIVKVQKAGGGYLVKKNMWTVFGGMPLYHMGGAAVSYVLLDGTSGQVKAAGVVPIHGGFVKAGDVRDTLSQ